ncbi:hypothetical protein N2M27_000974 [Vibrio parahaemolyticus]|nr:hypothetical protein [Vibrio parahaemolyticus]EJX1332701.1 hypothetical protein [Vibrio parahaemolyticus]
MSVDKLRGSYHVNRVSPNEIGLLLSAQSYRPAVTEAVNKIKEGEWSTLQSLISNVISPGPHPKYDGTYPCLKTKNVQDLIADTSPADWADVSSINDLAKVQVGKGDLLINLTGAGSIGRVSVYYGGDLPITNQHIAKMSPNNLIDEGYLVAYLRSFYAERALEQGVAGSTGQINMVNEHVRCTPVRICHSLAQKYIGEKVRQAERLRSLVKLLDCELNGLVLNDALEEANRTAIQSFNRVDVEDMFPRLDPKYYGNRSLSVLHAAASSSYSLDSLKKSINNGFEERDFVDSGIDYITVSEVSSGRIELSTAPKISALTDIPDKAYVNERCVLVVRTGSIGTAVKVDVRDKNAVISSHLIKLEFDTEELAAAVAAFLNSASGKVLQRKISYGAVQPQIGQDELLALPIPCFVLDNADSILALTQAKENAIRCSRWLTQSAKLFVEDLIEGQLTESQLVSAQQALEAGDDSLDRTLLECMTAEGIDGEGDPLFDDIDQLYDLLEQAKQALDADDTMAEA